jgi:hypothetical protein
MADPPETGILAGVSQTKRDLIVILILSILVLSLSISFDLPVLVF